MDNLRNDLFRNELELFSLSPTLDPVKPLLCDRWLALSAMQKSIRRGDSLTAKRALTTLYRSDPSSTWRRLLIIACEDVGIAALRAVVMTASRCANVKALRDTGKDEAAALATAQMLAEVPKDRSADLLFAVVLHDPTLEIMRSKCRSASVARRLEFVADPTLSLPERALAVWHSSGVESYGEPRVGPGDLGALMRTYAELGVPERLLEAVAEALTQPTLQWRHSAELAAAGVAAAFHKVHVATEVGAELVELVANHIADLNAIRSQLLSCALPPDH